MTTFHSMSKAELTSTLSGYSLDEKSGESFSGVEFDSRKIQSGNLFVAYQGENTHGHQFLESAFKNGASLALVEDRELLDSSPYRDALIYVPDTVKALNTLALEIRKRIATPTLAITGSMGKTTVKALSRSILSAASTGTAAQASYNNHIGVAYTICNSSPDDSWLVLEMGMNAAGELTMLTEVGIPDVAIITSIAPVHVEFFSGVEDIAKAKLEILLGIKEGGTLILNGDDEILMSGYRKWVEENGDPSFSVRYFGTKAEHDLQIDTMKANGFSGYTAEYDIDGERHTFQLNTLGKHNVMNTAAAVLSCKTLLPELTISEITEGLHSFAPEKHRLNIIELDGDKKIIDDSYNANPVAVKASLDLLKDFQDSGMRTGVVLGDMTEIGEQSVKYHKEVGDHLRGTLPGFVYTVGKDSQCISEIAESVGIESKHFSTPEDVVDDILDKDFDVLLVKGSRSVGLDRAVKKLVET